MPFTVAGIESDDNGTVSFSDGSHAPVVVNIVNGVPAASTVNVSGLNDGAITATLHLNNDAAGNSFTNVVATATPTQLDHWNNTSGGNWATASNWTTWNGAHAAPTATIDADFDARGTYKVSVTTADTAYGAALNDGGATVSEGSGGTLTLAGTSGINGALMVNAGTSG